MRDSTYSYGFYSEETYHKAPAISRRLVVIMGFVNPKDMPYLWMASEKEVLVTGDQSLGEAIACNKSYVYECLEHKKSLLKDIKKIYCSFQFSIGSFSPQDHDLRSSNLYSVGIEIFSSAYTASIKDGYKILSQINQLICEKNDVSNKVLHIIQNFLDYRFKHVRDESYEQPGEDFDPKKIKPGVSYFLSLDQVQSMKIDSQSDPLKKKVDLSSLAELNRYIFDWGYFGSDFYVVKAFVKND